MKTNGFESLGIIINDLDPRLPKGRTRCFDIGICGGCGVGCAAFIDGECEEPQEISIKEIIDFHGDDAAEVIKNYDCYKEDDKGE